MTQAAIARSFDQQTVSVQEVESWLDAFEATQRFEVAEHDLEQLNGWSIDPDTWNIAHSSGRFFTVLGAQTDIRWGREVHSWQQPIIRQRDIGILGLLAAEIDGALCFLVQAKMEPGNRRLVQVSPTVQATASNFERVHEGSATPYLEFFRDPTAQPGVHRVLVHQQQVEQANRYLGKRNLNAIVLIDAAAIEFPPDRFRWLTLADLGALAAGADLLHMDTRSILGALPLDPASGANPGDAADLLAWLAAAASEVEVETREIPLRSVPGWSWRAGRYASANGPFEILGVRVTASSREVAQWDQPLIANAPGTTSVLAVRPIADGHQVLVTATTGLGAGSGIELGPTLMMWPEAEQFMPSEATPGLLEAIEDGVLRFENDLPEEGGRFFHSAVRHRIIEVSPQTPAGKSRRWADLGELRAVGARTSAMTMELRSLLACLPADLRGTP